MKKDKFPFITALIGLIIGYVYGIIDCSSGFDMVQVLLSSSVAILLLIAILYKSKDDAVEKEGVA